MISIFKIIGALGLIFIILGAITKSRKKQYISYIIGGILLEAYSLSIKDFIFIPLQLIFVLVAIYELFKIKK